MRTILKQALVILLFSLPASSVMKLQAQQQGGPANRLQEIVNVFNLEFCPPEEPINEINSDNLGRLLQRELIAEKDIPTYQRLVIVDGKVYIKGQEPKPEPQPEPFEDQQPVPEPDQQAVEPKPEPVIQNPKPTAGKNFSGALDTACEALENEETRGDTQGNQKPEGFIQLKPRRVTYRDQQNQLQQMEVYSPPKFPAKKKNIAGKKGKKIKDYATSVIVPKDNDTNLDKSAFEGMPSSEDWLDDDTPQKQNQ